MIGKMMMVYLLSIINFAACSIGISAIIMAILAYKRLGERLFKYQAIVLAVVTLFAIVELGSLYQLAVKFKLSASAEVISHYLYYSIVAGMVYAITRFFYRLLSNRFLTSQRLFFGGLALLNPLLYGVIQFAGIQNENFRAILHFLPSLWVLFLLIFVLHGYRQVKDHSYQAFLKSFIWAMAIFIPLFLLDSLVVNRYPSFFKRFAYYFPFTQIGLVVWGLINFKFLWGQLLKPAEDRKSRLLETARRNYNLSERETEVLALLMERRGNREIAAKLFITLATVKSHVHNILQKMEARSRAEIVEMLEVPRKESA